MTRAESETIELCIFGREVRDDSTRSLDLLRAIDATLANLARLRKKLDADTEFAAGLLDALTAKQGRPPIDPDDKLCEVLLEAQRGVERLHATLLSKQRSAETDADLRDEDGIADVYAEVVASAAALHNKLNDLRWAVGEHDADLETPSEQTLSTSAEIDAFFATL